MNWSVWPVSRASACFWLAIDMLIWLISTDYIFFYLTIFLSCKVKKDKFDHVDDSQFVFLKGWLARK